MPTDIILIKTFAIQLISLFKLTFKIQMTVSHYFCVFFIYRVQIKFEVVFFSQYQMACKLIYITQYLKDIINRWIETRMR